MIIINVLCWISIFIIFWAMIGYPLSLKIIDAFTKRKLVKDYSYEPTVTIMVVAHNEEIVIKEKLLNLLELDYPKEKIEYLITSDYSTDNTDRIVDAFIEEHPDLRIRLHRTINHHGKTNAQNEAQKLCDSEVLVLSDANAMFEANAVRELVASFSNPSIAYVSGKLKYSNTESNSTANSEGFYWRLDLMCRDIESRIQTITAGNGAIYAVRNSYYRSIDPIECHDSSFPVIYALENRRAIYNPEAIAFEKAGENSEDEFKRKVRMNRIILRGILPDIRVLNIYRYHWFSYFYFGHRTCRYLLWLMHAILLIGSVVLLIDGSVFWGITTVLQLVFYFVALLGWVSQSHIRIVQIIFYYSMTVLAQWVSVIRIITGKTKPVWEKAESTR